MESSRFRNVSSKPSLRDSAEGNECLEVAPEPFACPAFASDINGLAEEVLATCRAANRRVVLFAPDTAEDLDRLSEKASNDLQRCHRLENPFSPLGRNAVPGTIWTWTGQLVFVEVLT